MDFYSGHCRKQERKQNLLFIYFSSPLSVDLFKMLVIIISRRLCFQFDLFFFTSACFFTGLEKNCCPGFHKT